MGKGRRKHFGQKAISHVISVTMMTGLVIALGIATLAWAQGVSLNFIQSYSSAVNADIDRLKERLTTEYINYKTAPVPERVKVYIINCGMIDDVAIQNIIIRKSDGTSIPISSITLNSLGGSPIPDLDQRQEGYIEASLGASLNTGEYYFVTIVTVRGAVFNAAFVV